MFDNSVQAIKRLPIFSSFILFLLFLANQTDGQQILSLKVSVKSALNNYGTVKAKDSYLKASQASVKQATSVYLPNLNVAAQQAYGTANGQSRHRCWGRRSSLFIRYRRSRSVISPGAPKAWLRCSCCWHTWHFSSARMCPFPGRELCWFWPYLVSP